MKTYSPKPEHIEHRWYVIDAGGQVLGRVASEAAAILRGKHKPIFAPHMDTGDNVIIVNAAKVEITGNKATKKFAYRHSGYPGGITATAYGKLMVEKPAFAVEKAIRGMLPKNRLGRAMISKLHVVPGPEHRHQAQKPVAYTLGHPPMWEGLPGAAQPAAVAKPVPKVTAETAKPVAKAPAAEPSFAIEEPAAEPKVAAKSTAKTVAKTTAKAPAKPAAKSPAKSAAKPAAKTTAKPTTKSPAKKTTAKATAKSPAKKTTAKATAKSPAKKTTARKPAAKTTAKKPKE
jgi:large subunit ribosomal protein L13